MNHHNFTLTCVSGCPKSSFLLFCIRFSFHDDLMGYFVDDYIYLMITFSLSLLDVYSLQNMENSYYIIDCVRLFVSFFCLHAAYLF